MSDVLKDELNRKLARIGAIEKTMAGLAEECERKLAPIRAGYEADIEELKQEAEALVSELVATCKRYKAALFAGDNDRLDLAAGAIIYVLSHPLIKSRGIVETLENAGPAFSGLLRVVKEADWDKLDKLPATYLKALGLKRRTKVAVSYEAK